MPLETFIKAGGQLVGSDLGNVTPNIPTQRSSLEAQRGSYIPGKTSDTVGVPASAANATDWSSLEADSLGRIYLDNPNVTYKHVNFWGTVIPRATGIKILECRTAGMEPEIQQSRGIQIGAITNYGSNPPYIQVEDTLIDGYLWAKERGSSVTLSTGSVRQGYGGLYGVHGGNGTFKRVLVRNVTDGFNVVGPTNNTNGRADAWKLEVLDSWIYHCDWANGVGTTPEGYHSDGGQSNTGKNVRFAWNLIGIGPVNENDPSGQWVARDPSGYAVASPEGFNAGNDWWNSCFMLQQESAGTTATGGPQPDPAHANYWAWVSNWIIEENWLAGGAATIQMTGKLGNDLSTFVIRNNKLLRRNTTVASHGILNGNGYYIYRILTSGSINASITGNVIWDWTGAIGGTGTAAPIVDKTV